MSLARLIDRMVAAGMSAGEAGSIAAEIYAAGVASTSVRTSGAERTRRWRASQSDGKRHQTSHGDAEPETSQTVTERHKPSQSDASTNPPISTSKNSKESKRQDRGTRIPADWSLTDPDRAFAKQEGFSDWEIQREAQKFRDYWTACAGSKGVKRDWTATWRQWIRSGADRAGKTPAPMPGGPRPEAPGFYAKAESEQLAAWDDHMQRTTGKRLPRDRDFGWQVKSEWPPDYVPSTDRKIEIDAPLLRAMQ